MTRLARLTKGFPGPWRGVRMLLLPAVLTVFLTAAGASGRNALVSSEPAEQADLATSPADVVLTFAVPVEPAYSSVAVLDGARHRLDGGRIRRDPDHRTVLRVPLERPASGPCTIVWKAVDAAGHSISGKVAFQVAAPAPSSGK